MQKPAPANQTAELRAMFLLRAAHDMAALGVPSIASYLGLQHERFVLQTGTTRAVLPPGARGMRLCPGCNIPQLMGHNCLVRIRKKKRARRSEQSPSSPHKNSAQATTAVGNATAVTSLTAVRQNDDGVALPTRSIVSSDNDRNIPGVQGPSISLGLGSRESSGLGPGMSHQAGPGPYQEQERHQHCVGDHPVAVGSGGQGLTAGTPLGMNLSAATPGQVRPNRRRRRQGPYRNYQLFTCLHCQHVDKCAGSDRGAIACQVSKTPTSVSSAQSSRLVTPFSTMLTHDTPTTSDARQTPRLSPAVPGTPRVLASPDFLRVAATVGMTPLVGGPASTLPTGVPPGAAQGTAAQGTLHGLEHGGGTPNNNRGIDNGSNNDDGKDSAPDSGDGGGTGCVGPHGVPGDRVPSASMPGGSAAGTKPALAAAKTPGDAAALAASTEEMDPSLATAPPATPTVQQASLGVGRPVDAPPAWKVELPRPKPWTPTSLSSLPRPVGASSPLLSPLVGKSMVPGGLFQATPGSGGKGHLGRGDLRGGNGTKGGAGSPAVAEPMSAGKSKRKRSGKWQSLRDIVSTEADD